MKKFKCLSTHGGAGYAPGSVAYITRNKQGFNIRADVKCACGMLIKNASPTGARTHYYKFKENPIKWFKNEAKFVEPTWPDWMTKKYSYENA